LEERLSSPFTVIASAENPLLRAKSRLGWDEKAKKGEISKKKRGDAIFSLREKGVFVFSWGGNWRIHHYFPFNPVVISSRGKEVQRWPKRLSNP
jgi:hypothetical protein